MEDTAIFHRTDNNSLDFGRIGNFIKAEKLEVESYLGRERLSAYNYYPTYIFPPSDISEHVQNQFLMNNELKELKLDDNKNFQ